MADLTPLMPYLIHALAGAVGGNIIGALRRTSSVGPWLNTLLGAGGGLAAIWGVGQAPDINAQILALMGGQASLSQAALGLIGGLIPPLAASLFRKPS